jgi:phospholipid/cholesterol/gamma-HCH transport system substrate-binding protein
MIRRITLVLIVLVGLAAIAILILGNPDVGRLAFSRHHLKACFNDVQGVHSGAPVRLAGVDIGTVRHVRANPQNKYCPAEIEIDVATSYEIGIPRDSMVEVATAGVLGETYIQIDSSQASGPPIEDYGYLRAKPSAPQGSIENSLKILDGILKAEDALRAAQQGNCGQGTPSSSEQLRLKHGSPVPSAAPK